MLIFILIPPSQQIEIDQEDRKHPSLSLPLLAILNPIILKRFVLHVIVIFVWRYRGWSIFFIGGLGDIKELVLES
jgi:hypothetical protein